MASVTEHHFICLLAIYNSSLENLLFILFTLLLIVLLVSMMFRFFVVVAYVSRYLSFVRCIAGEIFLHLYAISSLSSFSLWYTKAFLISWGSIGWPFLEWLLHIQEVLFYACMFKCSPYFFLKQFQSFRSDTKGFYRFGIAFCAGWGGEVIQHTKEGRLHSWQISKLRSLWFFQPTFSLFAIC